MRQGSSRCVKVAAWVVETVVGDHYDFFIQLITRKQADRFRLFGKLFDNLS